MTPVKEQLDNNMYFKIYFLVLQYVEHNVRFTVDENVLDNVNSGGVAQLKILMAEHVDELTFIESGKVFDT